MNVYHFIIIFLSAFFLFEFFKRLLAKGKIYNTYLIQKGKNPYLLMLIDYGTTSMSKQGMSEHFVFRIKKINLQNLKVIYEAKIARFSPDRSGKRIHIFGLNEEYIFVAIQRNDIVVISNKTGKRLCNKKLIVKKNPRLKAFQVSLCKYSHYLQSIIIFDNEGFAHLLDPDTVTIKQINFNTVTLDNIPEPPSITGFPSANLDNERIKFIDDSSFIYNVKFMLNKSDGGYFINIKEKSGYAKEKDLKHSFFNPKVLNAHLSKNNYLSNNPLSVLITHTKGPNSGINDMFVSRVNSAGKEVWRLALNKIAVKPKSSRNSTLYFTKEGKNIYFFYLPDLSPVKISISIVSKLNGKIIEKPSLFINR